jgi:hypothetical protein
VLREFCGCSPAYTEPALPSGLNAEPGADMERPGWLPRSSQLWFGWPVFVGPLVVLAVVVVEDCLVAGAVVVAVRCAGIIVEVRVEGDGDDALAAKVASQSANESAPSVAPMIKDLMARFLSKRCRLQPDNTRSIVLFRLNAPAE